MKVRLEQFEGLCAELQDSVDAAKARLGSVCNHSNPSSCLPTEILSHIMENVCSGSQKYPLGLEGLRMEVYLSHVCRRWRDVAIATPTLWTNIEGPEFSGHMRTMRTVVYLARSRKRLIDVSLFISADPFGIPRANWGQDFLKTIVPHSGRWRSFTLQCPEEYDDHEAEDIIIDALANISVPQLKSLDLFINLPDPGTDDSKPYIFLQATPRLSRLRLDATTTHWFIAPMNTITALTVHSSGASIPCLDLFGFPNLRHLDITRNKEYTYCPIKFVPPFRDLRHSNEVVTTRLVSLRLPIYDLPLFCEISPCLRVSLQNLQYLYLFDLDHFDDSDDDSYSDDDYVRPDSEWREWPDRLQELFNDDEFDEDLFPSLEHLSIDLGSMKPSSSINASSLCRLTKNISTLTVINGCIAPDTISGDGGVAWPRLRIVQFQNLPERIEECRKLVAWLAECGCRSDGTLSVALPARQVERLERSRNLQKEVQEMKTVVCLETTSVRYGDSWPPEDNSL